MDTQHIVHNFWLHSAPLTGKGWQVLCLTFLPAGIEKVRMQSALPSYPSPESSLFLGQLRLSPLGGGGAGGGHRGRWEAEGRITCAHRTRDLFLLPQVMVPSLDDIQQAINRMIQLTLEVSRGVAHWGQQPTRHMKSLKVSPSRTTDLAHPSAGKQLKREESKNATSQIHRVFELQWTSALLGLFLGSTACRYF